MKRQQVRNLSSAASATAFSFPTFYSDAFSKSFAGFFAADCASFCSFSAGFFAAFCRRAAVVRSGGLGGRGGRQRLRVPARDVRLEVRGALEVLGAVLARVRDALRFGFGGGGFVEPRDLLLEPCGHAKLLVGELCEQELRLVVRRAARLELLGSGSATVEPLLGELRATASEAISSASAARSRELLLAVRIGFVRVLDRGAPLLFLRHYGAPLIFLHHCVVQLLYVLVHVTHYTIPKYNKSQNPLKKINYKTLKNQKKYK